MASGRNKYQSRQSRRRIRELFMREWDPIGVSGIDQAADEYDTYVDRAYVMLMDDNADSDAIASYLYAIATQRIGLSESEELNKRCRKVAAILLSLRPEFLTH